MDQGIEEHKSSGYEIPEEGNLGLLALGHIGLRLWREKKKSAPRFDSARRTS